MKNQQGFTLIELMIVVAIIAILAAIALPAYRDYTVKAKITNALGGLAGEKIKVGENFGAGKATAGTGVGTVCENVSAAANCSGGTIRAENTPASGVFAVLTPSFPATGSAERITWACSAYGTDVGASNVPSGCTVGAAPAP